MAASYHRNIFIYYCHLLHIFFSFFLFFFFFLSQKHTVQRIKEENSNTLIKCEKELTKYLTEGVLTEEYVLDHIPPLMNCLRRCNVILR